MDNKTFKNYTPEQVDQFLDQVIKQVERMIEDNKAKNREIALRDKKIEELSKIVEGTANMQQRLAQYERMEVPKGVYRMDVQIVDKVVLIYHNPNEITDGVIKTIENLYNYPVTRETNTDYQVNGQSYTYNILKVQLVF